MIITEESIRERLEADKKKPCRLPTWEEIEFLLEQLRILRRWKREAIPVMLGIQDIGRALDLPLGTNITGPDALVAIERLKEALDAQSNRSD